GLVERRRRPADGRAWGLHLTPRGAQTLDKMKAAVLVEDRRRAARLSAAERRELLRLLDNLAG
ncbi:MAG: MarR family transcriptional regulator, partial [Burkholderiales bacterium]